VLRRIFRPKMEEVTGKRRKLYSEEITDLHTSPHLFE
jgi:hypothetical protein